MGVFRILLAMILALSLLGIGVVAWVAWGNPSTIAFHGDRWRIEVSTGDQAAPGSSTVEPEEDPAPVEQPLAEACSGVVVSGAVDVTIVDSPRNRVVVHSKGGKPALEAPRVVQGELLIQGGAMDLDAADLPSVTVYRRGLSRVIHRGKGDLWALHLTGAHLAATTTGEANLYVGGQGQDLRLQAGGDGSIYANWIAVDQVEVVLEGSGNVEPTGEWGRLTVRQEGSGRVWADGAVPAAVEIRLTGEGSAEVGLASTLDATITGDGRITASGQPTVTKHITGQGVVEVQP